MDNPNLDGFFLCLANPQPSPPSVAGGVDKTFPDVNPGSGAQSHRRNNKDLKDAPRRLHERFVDIPDDSRPKHFKRKPLDASSGGVTDPCSECGKRFWSKKALFGHMRCHPERQWRGINPPPHLRRSVPLHSSPEAPRPLPKQQPSKRPRLPLVNQQMFQEAELEAAAYLLMLANGPARAYGSEAQKGAGAVYPTDGLEWSGFGASFDLHRPVAKRPLPSRENVEICFRIGMNEAKGTSSGICSGNNTSSAASGSPSISQRMAGGMMDAVSNRSSDQKFVVEEQQTSSLSASNRGHIPDLNLPPPIDDTDASALPISGSRQEGDGQS